MLRPYLHFSANTHEADYQQNQDYDTTQYANNNVEDHLDQRIDS